MIHNILENILDENYIYGFADLRGLLHQKFSNFQYGISIARKLDDNIINSIEEGPTLEYMEHYQFINSELTNSAEQIMLELKKNDISSLVISLLSQFPLKNTRNLLLIYLMMFLIN